MKDNDRQSPAITDNHRQSEKRPVEMRKTLSIAAALFLLAVLHVTGVIAVSNLSHPYWHVQATLVGATIGVAMTICLFWLIDRNAGIARALIIVMALAFPVSLVATWVSADIFIESANFEWLAGQFWHKGYQILVALFVTLVAFISLRYAKRF